jgi:mycofactocin system glycosyltransferase
VSAPGGRRYELDRRARRSPDGGLLIGGVPGRLIRLSASGAAVLDELLAGRPDAAGEPALQLLRRLLDAGLVHPVPASASAAAATDLTTVVPVRDGGPALGPLVAALAVDGEVIVVDDRSCDGSAQVARAAGARVVSHAGPPGPAGARNAGLRMATTAHVAFVDADCEPTAGWSSALTGLLDDDPRLALAAPRVRSVPGSSRLARYETGYSPLDLGGEPSLVGPGRRVGYLPSAALVARRSALLAVGGFDERLTVGEDVDLVMRLLAAGWAARYAPAVEVFHRPRATAGALARQRHAYGRSAATLERLHPGAAAPLRARRATAAVWVAGLAGPRAAGLALAATALRAARLASDGETRQTLAALAIRGQLESSRHLARVIAREWLPLSVALALRSSRGRRALALAIAVDLLAARRPDARPLALPARLALRVLDNASYSAGLWRGVVAERSLAALAPASSVVEAQKSRRVLGDDLP